jgi:hypothetical protein
VKSDSEILLQELPDGCSFVSRKVVEDDVDLLPQRADRDNILKKGNELATGVARRCFPVTLPDLTSKAA